MKKGNHPGHLYVHVCKCGAAHPFIVVGEYSKKPMIYLFDSDVEDRWYEIHVFACECGREINIEPLVPPSPDVSYVEETR